MPTPSAVRLLLSASRPSWLSVGTGRADPIGGLPALSAGYGFVRVAGGWAVLGVASLAGSGSCNMCAGPVEPVYFVPNGSTHATRLGTASWAAAATAGGALWLQTYRPGADISTAAGVVQEVNLAGRPLTPRYRLPGGYLVQRAIAGDLLLAATVQGPSSPKAYELWNPRRRHVVQFFPEVIAASPRLVAWMDPAGCQAGCPVRLFDPATGASKTISLPGRAYAINTGTFSADGTLLAVQASAAIAPDGQPSATRFDVIDVPNRRVLSVPGSLIGTDSTVSFGWQADTDCLVAAVLGRADQAQVATWEVGASHLLVTTVRIPRTESPVLGDD